MKISLRFLLVSLIVVAYNLTAYSAIYYCASSNGLNLRNTRSIQSEVLLKIPFGAEVETLEIESSSVMIADRPGQWVNIRYGQITGFIHSGFISKKKLDLPQNNQKPLSYIFQELDKFVTDEILLFRERDLQNPSLLHNPSQVIYKDGTVVLSYYANEGVMDVINTNQFRQNDLLNILNVARDHIDENIEVDFDVGLFYENSIITKVEAVGDFHIKSINYHGRTSISLDHLGYRESINWTSIAELNNNVFEVEGWENLEIDLDGDNIIDRYNFISLLGPSGSGIEIVLSSDPNKRYLLTSFGHDGGLCMDFDWPKISVKKVIDVSELLIDESSSPMTNIYNQANVLFVYNPDWKDGFIYYYDGYGIKCSGASFKE